MYTRIEEAIHLVFIAFKGKKRKKEDIDLAFHSIMVGSMLKDIFCDEDTVLIGYLHDIIEDTKYTYNDLLEIFDKKIADGVAILTEDKKIVDYKERKMNFISNLRNAPKNILLVELADKLQNLLSDYQLFLIGGREKLITEADNYENLEWYYITLQELFHEKLPDNELLARYDDIMTKYFKDSSSVRIKDKYH